MAIHKAKIFTVSSVKGGVGKTTTALNLAGTFSKMNQRVLLVDFDLYGSAIASTLNLQNEGNVYKMVDDLANNRFHQLDDYIISYNESIDVLPAPNDPRFASKLNMKFIPVLFNKLTIRYDVIIVDTHHIIDEINLITFDLSDVILYVISNDPIDLKSMKSMVSIFKDMEKDNYKILLNNAKDKTRNHFSKFDVKNIIKANVDYIIPNDFFIKNIDSYVLDGSILTLNKKIVTSHAGTIKKFRMLAEELLKEKR